MELWGAAAAGLLPGAAALTAWVDCPWAVVATRTSIANVLAFNVNPMRVRCKMIQFP